MAPLRHVLLALLAWAPACPGAGLAADPPADAPQDAAARVRGWVMDLASDSYEVREQAREALEKHGREAPEVLRQFQDDPDPEIRRSVRGLLGRLEKVVEPLPEASTDLARVGRVSLRAVAQPLGRLLADLDAGLAARVRLPEELRARPVDLTVEEAPCFAALEALAAAVGLAAWGPFDADGVLTFAPPGEEAARAPSGTAGPVRVRAVRVEASRPLDVAGPALHGLTLEVQLAPCVQLVSYRTARVTAAQDAAGRSWRAAPGADASTTYGVGGDARSFSTRVTLGRADPSAEERLARLDLVLDLRLRHERRSVAFTQLGGLPRTLDLAGQATEAGRRGSVTLESVAPAEERADAWVVEVACALESATARASAEVWLELADGARRRLWITGGRSSASADGKLRMVGRVFGAGVAAPRAVHVAWFERESAGELPVTLLDVPLR